MPQLEGDRCEGVNIERHARRWHSLIVTPGDPPYIIMIVDGPYLK
jgi:hypothetical protein